MASAAAMDVTQPFPVWLETHLRSFNEDVDSCLVDYIVSMLDVDDEDDESLREGLTEILTEIAGDATSDATDLIVNNWKTHRDRSRSTAAAAASATSAASAFDSVLASALEKQSIAEAKPQRKLTKDDEERLQVKEAILNLAAASAAEDASDEEGDEEDGDGGGGGGGGGSGGAVGTVDDALASPSLVPANMNVQKVLQEQKDKRDAAQKQAEAKKAKDKEDREKQKNQKIDKAEAEKKRTQKGERRR